MFTVMRSRCIMRLNNAPLNAYVWYMQSHYPTVHSPTIGLTSGRQQHASTSAAFLTSQNNPSTAVALMLSACIH